jgi:hypothetical protein
MLIFHTNFKLLFVAPNACKVRLMVYSPISEWKYQKPKVPSRALTIEIRFVRTLG